MKIFAHRLFTAALPLCLIGILANHGIAHAASAAAPDLTPVPISEPVDLKKTGVLGFTQEDAMVVCDTKELRLSVRNDAIYLYAQAVVWGDGDNTLGETDDGRKIGDSSSLIFAKGTSDDKPRTYYLNPWPSIPGLYYTISYGGGASSHLTGDSTGRGIISYVNTPSGKVRVDTFVIPLVEIKSKLGDTIRFAYYGDSPTPKLTVNSVGYTHKGIYAAYNLPEAKFAAFKLGPSPSTFDIKIIPDGRLAKAATKNEPRPMPEIGKAPPEIHAKDWLNTDTPVTLAQLKGKVVVIDFWATWCGPCVESIPHMCKLQQTYEPQGLVIIGLTEQNKTHIADFLKKKEAPYIHGTGTDSIEAYGVNSFPHVFVIGRDGNLLWHGLPWDKHFEKVIETALAAK